MSTNISNEAREAAQSEINHAGLAGFERPCGELGHFVQLAINTAIEASAKREAELREVAKELADGLNGQRLGMGSCTCPECKSVREALARYQKLDNAALCDPAHWDAGKPKTL